MEDEILTRLLQFCGKQSFSTATKTTKTTVDDNHKPVRRSIRSSTKFDSNTINNEVKRGFSAISDEEFSEKIEEERVKKEAKLAPKRVLILKKLCSESALRAFSIFTPKISVQWREYETMLIGMYGGKIEGRSKIAGFDLDWTLIKVKGKNKLPKDENDWMFLYQDVPKRLKQLYEEGYKIVIFSNQGSFDADKKDNEKKRNQFKDKIQQIANKIQIPFQILAGTSKDIFRKPMSGAWDYFVNNQNEGIPVDLENSFYVGDAAGRIDGWKPGALKDWADSDLKFADNIKVKFFTPEEFFVNEKTGTYSYGDFDPKTWPHKDFDKSLLVSNDNHCEVIVLTGYPASGKSTLARYLVSQGYAYVNLDQMKTKAKCIKACEQALREEKPVVIDNTNPDIESRKTWIDLATKYKAPARCFWLQSPEALSKHNNMYRAFGNLQKLNSKSRLIPDIAYNTYKARFMEPQLEEGFEEIKKIDFVFEGNEEERARWEK
ncbi:9916_t:CDS:10, partial [Ambispora gerdemannii]